MMRSHVLWIVTALFPVLLTAQEAETPIEQVRQIREILIPLLDDFPGLSVAVGRNGEIVYADGFGFADPGRKTRVTQQTRFRIFSIAKQWTNVAMAQLVERGKLDLQASVQQYVPYFPKKEYDITPLQLAYHQAGIRHYKNEKEVYSDQDCQSVREAVGIFQDDSLLFEPGTLTAYSSWGYVLLSAVIEGASGRTYEEFMQENLFRPLGMTGTAIFEKNLPSLSAAFEKDETGKFKDVSWTNPRCKWGAGGFVSTPSDVVRLSDALLSGKLIKPEFVRLIMDEVDQAGIHYLGGVSAGGHALVRTDTRTGLIVAITGNARGVDLKKPADQIAALWKEKKSVGHPIPQWLLDDWAARTRDGGNWVTDNADFKSENEPFDAYGILWEYGLGEKHLRGRLYGIRDGQEIGTFWQFLEFWDPAAGEARIVQIASDGTVGQGRIWRQDDGSLKEQQTFTSPDGGSFESGHHSWMEDGTHHTQSFRIVEGEWVKNRLYKWALKKVK